MRRKFRRGTSFILSTLLTVMMVFGNFNMTVLADGDDPDPAPLTFAGEGTQTKPYIIDSTDAWNLLAAKVNSSEPTYGEYYQLTEDISVTTPIGTKDGDNTFCFEGVFDGNGKEIAVNISGGADGIAPFNYIKGATIENLRTIGSVTAGSGARHAAGLVGYVWENRSDVSNITNCIVSVNVSGTDYAGGIVGHAKSATLNLTGSAYTGNITANTNYIGGLVGWNDSSKLNLTNCYSLGGFSGTAKYHPVTTKGGTNAAVDATVTNCFYKTESTVTNSSYTISAKGTKVSDTVTEGAISKKITFDGNDYYADVTAEITGLSVKYYGNGTDPVSVTYSVTFNGSDATGNYTATVTDANQQAVDIDNITDGGVYTLTVAGTGVYAGGITKSFQVIIDDAAGTESDPYIIMTSDDWNLFAERTNQGGYPAGSYFELGDDITITTTVGTETNPFAGFFKGNGNTITANITGAGDVQGVAPFSYIANAYISGVNVIGTVSAGTNGNHAAGLVGFCKDYTTNTIDNCVVSATVSGADYAGGIVGHGKKSNLKVTESVFDGTISVSGNNKMVGGLVGWSDASFSLKVTDCLFKGAYSNASVFHPVGLTNASNVETDIERCYYTVKPNLSSHGKYIGSNIGTYVSETAPDKIYSIITAFDGNKYYAPATVSGLEPLYFTGSIDITYDVKDYTGTMLTKNADYKVTITKDGATVYSVTSAGDYVFTFSAIGTAYKGAESKLVHVLDKNQKYVDVESVSGGKGEIKYVTKDLPGNVKVVTSSDTVWTNGWYIATGDTTIPSRVTVDGDNVHLVLLDGCTLTANGGVNVSRITNQGFTDKALTIYGQENGTGKLIADARSVEYAAGIGGYYLAHGNKNANPEAFGKITINGGVIEAYGGEGSAAIGGGAFQSTGLGTERMGIITINGGTITAVGSNAGAGIGGGNSCSGGTINIFGGQIDAVCSGDHACGIGSGLRSIGSSHQTYIYISWSNPDMSLKFNYARGFIKVLKPLADEDGNVLAVSTGYPEVSSLNDFNNKTLTPSGYQVSISDSIKNGTVSADKEIALEGDTVTLTATPDGAYVPTLVTCQAAGEEPVEITPDEQGNYVFTMPAADVEVNATFDLGVKSITAAWDSLEAKATWEDYDWIDYYEISIGSTTEGVGKVTAFDCSDLVKNNTGTPISFTITGYKVIDSTPRKVAEGTAAAKTFYEVSVKNTTEHSATQPESEQGGTTIVKLNYDECTKTIGDSESHKYYLVSGTKIEVTLEPNKEYYNESLTINGENVSSYNSLNRNLDIQAKYRYSGAFCDIRIDFSTGHEADITAFTTYLDEQKIIYFVEDNIVFCRTTSAQRYGEVVTEVKNHFSNLSFANQYKLGWKSGDSTYDINFDKDIRVRCTSTGSGTYINEIIYFIWLDTINEVNVTLNTELCGSMINEGKGDMPVTFGDGEHVTTQTQTWANPDGTVFSGIIKGEDELIAAFDIYPESGYAFADDVTIRVNGKAVAASELEAKEDGYIIKKSITLDHRWVNGECVYCVERISPKLEQCAVLLDGQIGVEFQMDLPVAGDRNYADSYAVFSVSGRNGKTTRVNYSDSKSAGTGKRIFICHVNSLQMAETITGVYHYQDGDVDKTIEFTYSVQQYIQSFMADTSKYDETTINLVKELASYGYWIQEYLDLIHDEFSIRSEGVSDYVKMDFDPAYMRGITKLDPDGMKYVEDKVKNSNYSFDLADSGISKMTFALDFETSTGIRVYCRMQDEDYNGSISATVNGETCNVVKMADKRYRIDINGLMIYQLAEDYAISVTTGSGTATGTVSALAYVNGILKIPEGYGEGPMANRKVKYALVTYYYFYEAANAYRLNHQE